MTKKELSQLYSLNRETELHITRLAELEDSLACHRVCDTVQGSDDESPYIFHTQWIYGYPIEAMDIQARIRATRETIEDLVWQCAKERSRLEEFIASVPNSEMRTILTLRYVYGLPWREVAERIGTEGDGSTERKKVDRFLESFPEFPKKQCYN